MKKFLTYRTATILGWIGFALIVALFLLPRHSLEEWAVSSIGLLLSIVSLAAGFHRQGYIKGFTAGHEDARKIISEVGDRAYEDGYKTGAAHTAGRQINLYDSTLEAELNKGLAADKADERQWGTDYWDDIETEPTEAAARHLATKTQSNLYSRYPHCEWQPEPLTTEAGATK